MEIRHRVAINSRKDADFFETIKRIGIQFKSLELPGGNNNLIYFDMAESDLNWKEVSKLILNYGASDVMDTFFDDKEIRKAEWLRLVSTFEQGYPQPKLHWPIKQLTYKNVCPKCAVREQAHSMRIAKEPNLGKKSFMSLFWCGEIFGTFEVFEGLRTIDSKGYKPWDVLIHKSEKPSSKVKQLYISAVANSGFINSPDKKSVKCPNCGVVKYYPHMKGVLRLRRSVVLPGTDFLLTHDWFGSGYIAFREILVSNRVAQLILDRGWKGARLKVVELI